MDRLLYPLVFISALVMLAGCLAMPFTIMLARRGTPWQRKVLVTLTSYIIVMAVAGVSSYAIMPATYTKYHQWTLHPSANPLGEIHAVDLERIEHGAFSPTAATARRAEIQRERLTFTREWLALASVGLCAIALILLAWRYVDVRRYRHARSYR